MGLLGQSGRSNGKDANDLATSKLLAMAIEAGDRGDWSEAIKILEAIVAKHPENGEAQYHLLSAYLMAADWSAAERITQLADVNVDERDIWKVRLLFPMGDALIMVGHFEEARKKLELAQANLVKHPQNALEIHMRLQRLRAGEGDRLRAELLEIKSRLGTSTSADHKLISTPVQDAPELRMKLKVILEAKDLVGLETQLKNGLDPNLIYPDSWPLLLVAIRYGVECVRLLLEHGAKPNLGNRTGLTPLMLAASWGKVDILECLINHGADKNAVDANVQTALMQAASSGSARACQYLVSVGADVNKVDWKGETAFSKATSYPEVQEILKTAGARR